VGTYAAAKQALEAAIGVPAEGEWDGSRKYGETLLAGKKLLRQKGPYLESGYNCDAPEVDYFPDGKATYSDGSPVSLECSPVIFPVVIVGEMTNTPQNPHSDERANASMRAQIKRGSARRGYFYTNISEDAGSVSAVVPGALHLCVVDNSLKKCA